MPSPTKPPLLGIRISEKLFDFKERSSVYYYFIVGFRQKNEPFVTTPTIREEIDQGMIGRQIGEAGVEVFHSEKVIKVLRFYPFGFPLETESIHLRRKGIGNLIELLIEKDLFRRFPEYSIQTSGKFTFQRGRQLRRRGRNPHKSIPLALAKELTRKQVIRNHLRHSKSNSWRIFSRIIQEFRHMRRRWR
ncbi:MAG: hypothetical protein AABY11_03660 [archaeon]